MTTTIPQAWGSFAQLHRSGQKITPITVARILMMR